MVVLLPGSVKNQRSIPEGRPGTPDAVTALAMASLSEKPTMPSDYTCLPRMTFEAGQDRDTITVFQGKPKADRAACADEYRHYDSEQNQKKV